MKGYHKKVMDTNWMRIAVVVIALFLSAIVYNLFILPLNLVTGGTNGIAVITHYLYDIDPALMIFLLSAAFVVISYMYLGKEKTFTTIIVSILYPIFVELTANLRLVVSSETDALLLVIFAGALSGVSNGLIYKVGYNSGGTSVISQIAFEKFNFSIAKTSFIINTIVVLSGAFFFGITNALYAVIYLYINNIVTDKVLLGISNNKAFYIITNEEDKVKDYIINELKHDVTAFDVKGGFLDNRKKALLTVVPTREYYKMTEGIKRIDKKAFFVATDSYQVEGGK